MPCRFRRLRVSLRRTCYRPLASQPPARETSFVLLRGTLESLLDGDLRRPRVHESFGIRLSPGFGDLLAGRSTFDDAVHPAAASGLDVIAAGRTDRATLNALEAATLHKMFAQLRQEYDFIIVDSCPVLPVADALWIGQQVDGVVLSLLKDVSRLPVVYAAFRRLVELRIRVIGAVVSGAKADAYGYGYSEAYSYRPAVS